MTLVRWNPSRELEEMSDRLNRMFNRQALPQANAKETMVVADWVPSVDVSETDGEYQIKAEIPDVKKEDVKRGGSGWLDSVTPSLSGAWRVADYAAVRRVVRFS